RRLQNLLSAIPAAIYTTDAKGRVTYYNEAAVKLAGRKPTIGSDEWCLTWKLCRPDGTPLPHDESPMAVALKEGRAIRNAEAISERPDGTRISFIPYLIPRHCTTPTEGSRAQSTCWSTSASASRRKLSSACCCAS